MKTLVFIVLILLFAVSCKNDKVSVAGNLLTSSPGTSASAPVAKALFVYGNYFRVQHSSAYKTLMSSCRRCGLKRIISSPFGGTTYQRFWTLDDANPKRCENWISAGYLQIEFAENKLPTQVTVSIWPKYTASGGGRNEGWGQPFEVKGRANPINENKGFQILLSSSGGLGGAHLLDIQSTHSNHVRRPSDLNITVTYSAQKIISENITKLTKKAVPQSVFNCDTYSN